MSLEETLLCQCVSFHTQSQAVIEARSVGLGGDKVGSTRVTIGPISTLLAWYG